MGASQGKSGDVIDKLIEDLKIEDKERSAKIREAQKERNKLLETPIEVPPGAKVFCDLMNYDIPKVFLFDPSMPYKVSDILAKNVSEDDLEASRAFHAVYMQYLDNKRKMEETCHFESRVITEEMFYNHYRRPDIPLLVHRIVTEARPDWKTNKVFDYLPRRLKISAETLSTAGKKDA